jgi:hypothetical protein
VGGRIASGLRRRAASHFVSHIDDPVLGPMRYDEELDWWTATLTLPDGWTASLSVAGEDTPDPDLVAKARDLARSFDEFEKQVATFLKAEIAAFDSHYEDEIRSLRADSVSLVRPGSGDGMIYFKGKNDDRVWRCDRKNGVPTGLGFDS